MYNIDTGQESDIPEIQAWIGANWKKDHILARDRDFFKWQYFNSAAGQLNFVTGRHNNSNEIHSILGFIPTSRFDNQLSGKNEIFLALWKTDDNKSEQKGLGLGLLEFLQEKYSPDTICVLGINPEINIVYKFLEYRMGTLNHYYIPNRKKDKYTLAEFNQDFTSQNKQNKVAWITDMKNLPDPDTGCFPRKSAAYFVNRYQNHPVYNYQYLGLFNEDIPEAVLVVRRASALGASCLRIVDIFGSLENIQGLDDSLQTLLVNEDSEYIDCYNYGLPESDFSKMGFLKKTTSEIVPNHFEPFERANRDIAFAYKSIHEKILFFKGDGDQDRPSQPGRGT